MFVAGVAHELVRLHHDAFEWADFVSADAHARALRADGESADVGQVRYLVRTGHDAVAAGQDYPSHLKAAVLGVLVIAETKLAAHKTQGLHTRNDRCFGLYDDRTHTGRGHGKQCRVRVRPSLELGVNRVRLDGASTSPLENAP